MPQSIRVTMLNSLLLGDFTLTNVCWALKVCVQYYHLTQNPSRMFSNQSIHVRQKMILIPALLLNLVTLNSPQASVIQVSLPTL